MPSLSSSSSVISQIESISVSNGVSWGPNESLPHSFSTASSYESPSSSLSALLPIPSSSVSVFSLGSNGNASFASRMPSLSSSSSITSQIESLSVSNGIFCESKESLPHSFSNVSSYESPSSSKSVLSPVPSPSVSIHSFGLVGAQSLASR